jgi:manganese oxidase
MKNIKTILILPSLLLLTSGYAEALFGFTEITDAYVEVDTTAQVLPKAEPNDQRKPAGRMVNGELEVNLEAVEAEWYPRGREGPRIITPAFSEAGRSPHVPGPLIRTSAGTPVVVRVHNKMERTIIVRGLLDRATMGSPKRPLYADSLDADFFFADSLTVPPGETREVRFTPLAEVTSFYYGRLAAPEGGFANPFLPGNFGNEGIFLGGFIVDPPEVTTIPDERVFLITRWGDRSEPSTLTTTFKFMINGLSWPFTERLEHDVGDTLRWRIVNTSAITHPMHLHGFYFRVDGRGDTDTDTMYTPDKRSLVVTDVMPDFSTLRLTWVPDRPGNWLFHCHLIRHMSSLQRFDAEGEPQHHTMDNLMDPMEMDDMAGLILGLVINGDSPVEDPPQRSIFLWASKTPGVFDRFPALSFVATNGPEPPIDTLVVPGSPLVLKQNEPTEIIIHNRLEFPISVHWHGLEVLSHYDGVANWSGSPGSIQPPIGPGDSARVLITPPRTGTFIYHIHGEMGFELSQGLYGPFLVFPEGEIWNKETDRIFVLAARGARRDPPAVVNGRELPSPQRFDPDKSYRLRFIHISPDASKQVRLLSEGKPVSWQPRAKDGAELPDGVRTLEPAIRNLGVGETFDAEWRPGKPGVYTLEVVTNHYTASGLPPTLQRIAFGVGEVTDEELEKASHIEQVEPQAKTFLDTLAAIDLDEDELRRFTGTYTAPGVPVDFVVAWADSGLTMAVTGRDAKRLVPISSNQFRWMDDRTELVEFQTTNGKLILSVFGLQLIKYTTIE